MKLLLFFSAGIFRTRNSMKVEQMASVMVNEGVGAATTSAAKVAF